MNMVFDHEPRGCIRVEATMPIDEVLCLNESARVQVRFVGHRGESFTPAWGSVIAVFHDCSEADTEEPGLVRILIEVRTESLSSRPPLRSYGDDEPFGRPAVIMSGVKVVLGQLVETDRDHILAWRCRPRQTLN